MDYDPELFGKALPCLIAIGCALPPDYSLPQKLDDDNYGNNQTNPDQPQYNPQPINTSMITLDNDLNSVVQKFSEHYHDAWASRKMENGWTYGELWSDSNKLHPRLKPYDMLTDYVSRREYISCIGTQKIMLLVFQERERYKEPVRESLKALLALNWTVEHADVDAPLSNRGSTRRQSKPNVVSQKWLILMQPILHDIQMLNVL